MPLPGDRGIPYQVADSVGGALGRLGVQTVFGVVGSGNFVATNALIAEGASFHAARHEGGAVCMADGWSRVTGRVGVASVHQGPGLTNAMTGLAEAVKASTPLLVLAGDTPAPARLSNFRIDQHALVESVGAGADRVHSAASAGADAARALRRATTERRPIVLMMPIDLSAQPAAAPEGARVELAPLPAAPRPATEAIAAAADLLTAARSPLLIAGRGAVLADAGAAIEALGARTGALLATSAMANGLFAGNPFGLGISGGLTSPRAAELVAESDVIVAFGATLNHWTTRHGELIGSRAQIVQVDLRVAALGAHRPVTVAVLADAAQTAGALNAELEARGHRSEGRRTKACERGIADGAWRARPYEDQGTPEHIDPRTLSIALEALLPEDKAVAVDSGHFMGYPSMFLRVPDARAWLFANAFQAVGLGLGVAIGAAVARPERLTVAALGDGGLFMALEELETAARLGLRLLVVAYDDHAYGAEVHHFAPAGHDVSTVRFADADLAAIARGAGAEALTVRSPKDLAPVSEWLHDGRGPLVIDAKVNPQVQAQWLKDAFRAG